MSQKKSVYIQSLCLIVLCITIPSANAQTSPDLPFNNRIIFSETPEIGRAWRPGIRTKDLLCWDLFWNVNNWLTVDFLHAGMSNRRITDKETGDTVHWTDRADLFTVKSRPVTLNLMGCPYKIAFGFTVYSTVFEFYKPIDNSGLPADTFAQAGLFVAQSWYMKNRKWWIFDGSHYFNLVTSFESHKISDSASFTSWYFIPGYRFIFNHPRNLSFDFEYYFMNPYELPLKTLQVIVDPDRLPFENPNLDFVSFMFWGFSFSWKHARAELHLGHHISFSGPIVPAIGFGWEF
jgi:hypothetical protein